MDEEEEKKNRSNSPLPGPLERGEEYEGREV
jgi:hypothetical protein